MLSYSASEIPSQVQFQYSSFKSVILAFTLNKTNVFVNRDEHNFFKLASWSACWYVHVPCFYPESLRVPGPQTSSGQLSGRWSCRALRCAPGTNPQLDASWPLLLPLAVVGESGCCGCWRTSWQSRSPLPVDFRLYPSENQSVLTRTKPNGRLKRKNFK